MVGRPNRTGTNAFSNFNIRFSVEVYLISFIGHIPLVSLSFDRAPSKSLILSVNLDKMFTRLGDVIFDCAPRMTGDKASDLF